MEDKSTCPACGRPLTAGRCPSCQAHRWTGLVQREAVLLVVLVGISIAAFAGTRAIARGNDALRRRQAAAWYDLARRASDAGNAESAVAALRNAVAKDPGNRTYRLMLADGLAARRADREATRVLLALRDAQPDDPETNLRLARLSARGTDADAARRYYQNALASVWSPRDVDKRRHVRIELVEFLLAHAAAARALSELLVLALELPDDAALQTRVGRLFLAAGDPRRALDHFVTARRIDANDAAAAAGAGEAAFELGDYGRALRHLTAAPTQDARAADLREQAQLIVSGDPLAPRLNAGERRRRVAAAVARAVERLDACARGPAGQTPSRLDPLRDEARTFQTDLHRPRRRESRDLVADGVGLAYRIERAVDQDCAVPTVPLDRALVLIGRRHGFEEP